MGGRVAEKLVFDHLNSGAANDLEQATSIARRMVREWGMSDARRADGLEQPAAGVPRRGPDDRGPGVQRRHRQADRRGGRPHPHEQEERASELLTKHRRGLDLVAEALLEHETIDGREVARLIQQGLTESGDGDARAR